MVDHKGKYLRLLTKADFESIFTSEMDNCKEKYVEITASFSVAKESSKRFDLLIGIHPEEKRFLTEDEELPLDILQFMKRADLLSMEKPNSREKSALLWLSFFPQIDDYLSLNQDYMYEALWNLSFEGVKILNIAYAFYPTDFYSKYGKQNMLERKKVERAAKCFQQEIERRLTNDSRVQGKHTWTLPFPADGPLGRVVEQKAGLSVNLKNRIGLTRYAPGLLCNYLLRRNVAIENALDPYQFEDLTGMIFSEEGWAVQRMPKTRDGGKDIIARRTISNTPIVAYVQAKKYKQERKVGIKEIKEFVATVAGDNADKGFIVTSSYFSKPSIKWLQTKGASLATIEIVDRKELKTKMQRIANSETAAYLLRE